MVSLTCSKWTYCSESEQTQECPKMSLFPTFVVHFDVNRSCRSMWANTPDPETSCHFPVSWASSSALFSGPAYTQSLELSSRSLQGDTVNVFILKAFEWCKIASSVLCVTLYCMMTSIFALFLWLYCRKAPEFLWYRPLICATLLYHKGLIKHCLWEAGF